MTVTAGQRFPGGWSVASVAPRLVFAQDVPSDLLRRTVVPLGPAVLAAFLFGVTRDAQWGIQLAVWPVAFAFVGIAGLGVLNLVRSVRRRRHGVRLEVAASTVAGYPEARNWLSDYFVSVTEHPRSAVKGATLTVYRDAKRGAPARAKLRLELTSGGALVGPEAWGPDADWEEVRDALRPAGDALAAALGTPLQVTLTE